ncbi:MAG: hypothetical protein H0W58_10775 [Acidobacteria bacterium]|nr:hypothetical protein [Acidobacteriota bacterium]
MKERRVNTLLCTIPLIVGFLFAALMFYFAIISMVKAREYYQAKQFPGVKTVVVCVNGTNEFGMDWSKMHRARVERKNSL